VALQQDRPIVEASRDIEIINKLGMHARAAAKFVKLASSFNSDIDIEKDSRRVNAKSIMGVMMLAASKGSTVTIHAKGSDAENSIDALEQLIKDRFDEDE
jgi:phosphocarrier protein